MSNRLAPIALFVYNRPWHTQQVLEALMKNDLANESMLYIFSDGPKVDQVEGREKIKEVRKIVRKRRWCKEVIIKERKFNLGLAESIIKGVSEVVSEHGKIIVLEDDIKVEPNFLTYMNTALKYFQSKKKVFHINGFNNESNLQFLLKEFYFLRFMSCWGWATWKDRWDKMNLDYSDHYDKLISQPVLLSHFNYENSLSFHLQLKANIDETIKTWAILWFSTVYFNGGLCLTPKFSLVENIGMDGSGTHCGKNDLHKKIYKGTNPSFIKQYERIAYKESLVSRWHLKLFYKYGQTFNAKKFLKTKMKNLY